ncbi:hypothetical protein EO92_07765 [Methanosarcina sp. 2.H.A.1B.4]|nr:hypothetical protein EO92_07765 [Methanosarcina sp. 2.H.A.1B.4]
MRTKNYTCCKRTENEIEDFYMIQTVKVKWQRDTTEPSHNPASKGSNLSFLVSFDTEEGNTSIKKKS